MQTRQEIKEKMVNCCHYVWVLDVSERYKPTHIRPNGYISLLIFVKGSSLTLKSKFDFIVFQTFLLFVKKTTGQSTINEKSNY